MPAHGWGCCAWIAAVLVLLSGCINPGPVCNKPYIQVGTDCCLDRDGNRICDKDDQDIPATTVTLAAPATTTTAPPIQTTTTQKSVTTTHPAPPATSTTIAARKNPPFTVVYTYWQGSHMLWAYRPPALIEFNETVPVHIEINNTKNVTFYLHIQDDVQSEKCWKSPFYTDCRYGVEDYYSIRTFNQTVNMTGNWSISLDNQVDGSDYTIRWTFEEPSDKTMTLWDAWEKDYGGCLYYKNNGTTCEIWGFRECLREDLGVCNRRCCPLTDHRPDGKNITSYKKCYSSDEYRKMYNAWPYGYNLANIGRYYVWEPTRYKDNNCAEAFAYSKA
jgi:hypothetical protein